MLKNTKIIIGILLLIVVLCFGNNSYANSVEYRGKAEGIVSTSSNFFSDFGKLMPGDVKKSKIDIKNTTDNEIEVFFKIESLNKSEENDYLLSKLNLRIKLKQTVSSEEKVIYEGNMNAENMKNHISLGTYRKGFDGELTFEVEVPLNLNNEFAGKSADINWVFTVTEKKEEPEPEPEPDKPAQGVQTGDIIYFVVGVLVFVITINIIIFIIKKKKNDKEA